MSAARLLAPLRDAAWLNPTRARAYRWIFAGCAAVGLVGWAVIARSGVDPLGKALGTDFTSFWAASRLALDGRPADVYRPAIHAAAERAIFGGLDTGYATFFYPPVYLLICLPLALLPYLAALAVWLGATGYAYWRVARAALGKASGSALSVLAFPGVLVNLGHGQNGFLTAALLGGGALALRTRPIAAGVCLGAMIVKPHLGVLIPVALLAGGRWRAVASASATVLALVAASAVVFGLPTWQGFLAAAPLAKATMEQNLVGNEKLQSAFAAVRLGGGPLHVAYLVQALTALTVASLLIVLARRGRDPDALGPALVAGSLLASPFLLDYDLVLLAVPLAWSLSRAQRDGFLPWEKLTLALGFVLPLISRPLAARLGLPLGPPVILAVLWTVLRRGLDTRSVVSERDDSAALCDQTERVASG
jgi:alpha-1,2-mannosyltransferase